MGRDIWREAEVEEVEEVDVEDVDVDRGIGGERQR